MGSLTPAKKEDANRAFSPIEGYRAFSPNWLDIELQQMGSTKTCRPVIVHPHFVSSEVLYPRSEQTTL